MFCDKSLYSIVRIPCSVLNDFVLLQTVLIERRKKKNHHRQRNAMWTFRQVRSLLPVSYCECGLCNQRNSCFFYELKLHLCVFFWFNGFLHYLWLFVFLLWQGMFSNFGEHPNRPAHTVAKNIRFLRWEIKWVEYHLTLRNSF